MGDTAHHSEPFAVEETPAVGREPSVSDSDRILAGLAYLVPFVVSLILLLNEGTKAKPFLRYHAVQSLGLAVASAVFEVLLSIVAAIVCFAVVFYFLPLLPMVYYGVIAFQGKTFEIPYLTSFMKQCRWL